MNERPSEMNTLPVAVHRQIDEFCIAFERRLNTGKRPDLAKAVYRQKPLLQGPLLLELLAVELEWRLGKGEMPRASQYLEAFPDHVEIVTAVCRRVLEQQGADTLRLKSPAAETHDLLVRCPECHARISPGKGDLMGEITCGKCGVIFRLASQPSAKAKAGTRLGPFELLKELGAGAFGAVWRARDTRLDRFVAIKIPRRAQLSDEEFEKFLREARAAAQLKHPHIVQVHEVGRLGDVIYIVSDLIDGWSLADWLDGQRLTIRESVELAVPIADALHHAHECGVIHRDLKPANILIDRKGRPHLTDFGLARRETGEVTITIEGQILGTPAYMSPEQASGTGHLADRRTDIYSFGVLLFQLFTGELPFRGSLRVLLRQVIEDEPPSPRRLNSRLSRDLETIVLKCLEKDPTRRYATASDACEDLKRFLRDLPISARPVGRIERVRRWSRRNPGIAASIAAILITLTGATAVSSMFAVTAARSARLATRNEQAATKQEGLAKDAAARADERSQYAAEQETLAKDAAALAEERRMDAEEQQAAARDATALAEERRTYAEKQEAAAKDSAALAKRRLMELERSTYNLRLTSMNTDVQRNNLQQAMVLQSERFPEPLRDFAWRYCAWAAGEDLEAVVSLLSEQRPSHHFDNNVYRAFALSPQGELLAIADQAKRIVLYDWKTRGRVHALVHHKARILFLTFSPDGRQLAAGDENGQLSLWDVESGDRLFDHKFSSQVRSLAYSPDGARLAVGLAFTNTESPLWIINGRRELKAIKSATAGPLQAVRWTGDGKRLVVGTRNESNNCFALDIVTQKPIMVFHGGNANDLLYDIAASPTDSIVAVACKSSVNVWDLDSQKQITSLPTLGHRLDFSHNGKLLAVVAPNDVLLYDVATWKVVQQYQLDASPYPLVWFRSDDASLVCGASTGRLYQWHVGPKRIPAVCSIDEVKGEYVHSSLTGNRMLTASTDGPLTLRVRNGTTGALLTTVYQGKAPEDQATFLPPCRAAMSETDGQVFLICSREVMRCMDLGSGQIRWERRFPHNAALWKQLFSCWHLKLHDRSVCALVVPSVAVAGSSRKSPSEILLLDGQNGEEVGRLDPEQFHICAIAHAPKRGLIAGRAEGGDIMVWSDATFKKVASVACPALVRTIESLAFSPDEAQLVVADNKGALYRLNVETWQLEATNRSVTLRAEQIAFTPTGDTVLMCGEGEVLMVDPMTLESRGRIKVDSGMQRIVFDEQGEMIVTRRDGKKWLRWPIATYAGVAVEPLAE